MGSDFQPYDGIHPTAGANNKVAMMLMDFFTTDPNASQWFLEDAEPPPPLPPDPAQILQEVINEINCGDLLDPSEISLCLEEILELI